MRCGPVVGPQVNPFGLSADPMAGVTKDATSGIYVPASAAEWTKALAAAGITSGGPSLLWLMQEASGNLADSIGAFTGTVTVGSPALAYAQAVTGWSRKGIKASDGATGNVLNNSASLPDLSTTSMAVLTYSAISAAPAALRNVVAMGTTTVKEQCTVTPRDACNNGANTGGTADPTGAMQPRFLQHDVTHTVQGLYTLNDKILPAWNATRTGKTIELFSTAPPITITYCAAFFGAAAELTAAQVKKLYQTLGWAPTW